MTDVPDVACHAEEARNSLVHNTSNLNVYFADEKDFYKCPDRLRLPLIFYYCHPAVVFVNKLVLAGLIKVRLLLI